jgi:hypothetical protein
VNERERSLVSRVTRACAVGQRFGCGDSARCPCGLAAGGIRQRGTPNHCRTNAARVEAVDRKAQFAPSRRLWHRVSHRCACVTVPLPVRRPWMRSQTRPLTHRIVPPPTTSAATTVAGVCDSPRRCRRMQGSRGARSIFEDHAAAPMYYSSPVKVCLTSALVASPWITPRRQGGQAGPLAGGRGAGGNPGPSPAMKTLYDIDISRAR